jgi:hypothetical protein
VAVVVARAGVGAEPVAAAEAAALAVVEAVALEAGRGKKAGGGRGRAVVREGGGWRQRSASWYLSDETILYHYTAICLSDYLSV